MRFQLGRGRGKKRRKIDNWHVTDWNRGREGGRCARNTRIPIETLIVVHAKLSISLAHIPSGAWHMETKFLLNTWETCKRESVMINEFNKLDPKLKSERKNKVFLEQILQRKTSPLSPYGSLTGKTKVYFINKKTLSSSQISLSFYNPET